MSKNVIANLATKPTSFPSGTQGGDFVFLMGEQGQAAHLFKITTPETTATFVDVDPGKYWIDAARMDSEAGRVLGSKARVNFEVAKDNVLIETADFVGVRLADA